MALFNDPKLFETYLAPVLQPAYGTAYYLIQDSKEAENLVQEAALQAFTSFSLYQPGTSFAAWFMRVFIQVLLEKARRDGCYSPSEAWDDLPEASLPNVGFDEEASSRTQEASSPRFQFLTQQQIAGAFAQLPFDIRLIVALYFMEELSYQQIAEILDCPLHRVRTSLHRGRWALQGFLGSITSGKGSAAPFEMNTLPA